MNFAFANDDTCSCRTINGYSGGKNSLHTVKVVYKNGSCFINDRVKSPTAYIDVVLRDDDVIDAFVIK